MLVVCLIWCFRYTVFVLYKILESRYLFLFSRKENGSLEGFSNLFKVILLDLYLGLFYFLVYVFFIRIKF